MIGIVIDLDECMSYNGNCSDICVNTVGGFHCECMAGWKLQRDNKTCAGKLKLYKIELVVQFI